MELDSYRNYVGVSVCLLEAYEKDTASKQAVSFVCACYMYCYYSLCSNVCITGANSS